MRDQVDRLRTEFMSATGELREFVESCPRAAFESTVPGDGRTLRQVASHVIDGWQMVLDSFAAVQAGTPMPRFDVDSVNARNAENAELCAGFSRAETVAALDATAARVDAIFEFVTDELLAAPAPPSRVPGETIGQSVERVFVSHVHDHLDEMRELVSVHAVNGAPH
ncbi:MAG: DinB family protein [Candidatus Dormibacteria bacterium]